MTAALSDTVSASMLDRFTAIIDAFDDAAGGLTLDQIAGTLNEHPNAAVTVVGHTDDRGADDYNLKLSQQRAESVRRYLIGQGIAPDRMTSEGYGETRPIDDNNTPSGRAANRRVEFVILEQDGCQDN